MIEIHHLSKSFGPLRAVDDISFSVGRGEILGYLGPNGAGKSTTLKTIAGLLSPDSGTINIGGINLQQDPLEAKKRLGRSEEHTSELRHITISYAVFCLKTK